jgi:hypothetical protein
MSDAAPAGTNVGSRVVTVACKLPHGIKIRDHRKSTTHEPVMGGGSRKVEVFRPVGPTYRIKGQNVPEALKPFVEVVGGYAITQGMPAEIFERWMRWNEEAPYVKNNLIFGSENADEVRGKAREFAALTTGMEALDTRMKMNAEGRMEFVDQRIKEAGLSQIVDGKLELSLT